MHSVHVGWPCLAGVWEAKNACLGVSFKFINQNTLQEQADQVAHWFAARLPLSVVGALCCSGGAPKHWMILPKRYCKKWLLISKNIWSVKKITNCIILPKQNKDGSKLYWEALHHSSCSILGCFEEYLSQISLCLASSLMVGCCNLKITLGEDGACLKIQLNYRVCTLIFLGAGNFFDVGQPAGWVNKKTVWSVCCDRVWWLWLWPGE